MGALAATPSCASSAATSNVRGPLWFGGVKLQAANQVDRLRAAADFTQPRGIHLTLRADPGERGEQRPEQKPKAPVAAIGTFRQPGVHEKERNALDRTARQMKFGQISASTRMIASGRTVRSARETNFRRSIG